MPDSALTPDGLVLETEQETLNDLADRYRAQFGASLPIGDTDPIGFLFAIVANRLRKVDELIEAVYSSQDPDKATGASLETLSLLTGTFKLFAEPSTDTETLCGDDGTLVPDGSLVAVESSGKRFQTVGDVVLVVQPSWTILTSYAVGDQVTNAVRVYRCITAGLSAGSGGPTTTADDITDGTAHWTWLGDGVATADVPMTSIDNGAVVAVARDLNTIITVTGGWNTATNLKSADPGRLDMTDAELRLFRRKELQGQARSPADAIRAAILKLAGVDNGSIFMNLTDVVNGDGMPPHSVEALVQGGADQDVWDALWANVAAGIVTTGTEVGSVTDSEGTVQTLKFTRPAEIPIAVDVTIIVDPRFYPIDGNAQVKQAIVDFGNAGVSGKDAVSSSLGAQSFSVKGVLDVTATLIAIDPATPTLSTTIAISLRQLATYATSRVSITTSTGVP